MRRRSRLVVGAVCISLVVGCAGPASDGASFDDELPGDGGERALAPPESDGLDSGADAEACGVLIARTCGPTGTECRDSGSCEAAILVERYEPFRCADGLADAATFAPCVEDACTTLTRKVCGALEPSEATCEAAPGCAPARDLAARAADGALADDVRREAREACVASLEDELVFPPCAG